MFTNFDGDYKSRRNINLGGSNKARQDKEALLRQAQQERLMREQERRRMASASRIQAFYRGRRVSRHASQEQRQAFDHRVMPLLHTFADPSLAASERQSSPLQDPASLMDATARLLLFWSVSKDTDRLAALAVCLAQPSADADIPFVLLPFVRCADQGLRWKRLLVRLANCMLQTLSLAENTPKNDGADTASLAALYNLFDDFLLNTTNGPVLNRKTPLDSLLIYAPKRTCPVPADAPFDCVHLDDARFLIVQQGLFETVRAMITAATGTSATGPSATGDSRSSKAVHLAIAAMRSFTRTSMLFDGILVQFALQVLTVPSLLKARLRPADAAILRLGVPLDRLARLLAEIAQDDSSHPLSSWNLGLLDADTSQRSMLSLLANFMGLWETRVASSSASSAELSLYLTAMQSLLSAINPATFARVNAQSEAGREADTTLPQVQVPVQTQQPNILADAQAAAILAKISDQHHISMFMRVFQSPEHSRLAIAFFSNVIVLCSSHRDDLLNSVLFHPKLRLMGELWRLVRQSVLWTRTCQPTIEIPLPDDPEFAFDWNTLSLLAELLGRQLQTLGDDELLGPGFAIDRAGLIDLCSVAKHIVVSLCWRGVPISLSASTPSLPIDYIKTLFTRLIQQLHARDSRKPFCPPDHWLMENIINPDLFVELVIDGATTAATSPMSFGKTNMRIASCLEVLQTIPFVVPFEQRVKIFRHRIAQDRMALPHHNRFYEPVARVTIRRESVFEDGYTYLNGLGSSLRERVAISFVDRHGLPEAGIDGGGVFKEFLTSCLKQAFDSNYGLFQTTRDQLLYPSPSSYATQDSQLKLVEFLGRIIGKAMYEGVLIDAAFSNFFLSKWLGKRSYLEDLPSLDQELYNGLIFLKNYDGNVERDLALNFSVSENEFGVSKTIELVPNGSNIPVTNENRIRYIYLAANYKLNVKIARQCQAFFRGLSDLISPSWIRIFNEQELQILLGGNAVPIDIADLRANTTYNGVYDAEHPTIQLFWRVVAGFSEDERRRLVKFITSCSRPPLLGFRELQPQLCLRDSGSDEERLPSASTCVNLLKLPMYKSEDVLRNKLLYAINADAGFELS